MPRPYYDYEDRSAERRYGSTITPAVRALILANAAVFVASKLLETVIAPATGVVEPSLVKEVLGISREGVFGRLMVWQPLTYLFLHVNIWHLLWNMFALWVFGCDVERFWGTRRFFFYYFYTGIGAGLCIALLGDVLTIGASGAVLGVLVAFAMLFPDRLITLLLFFVFPITVKAKYLAIGYAVLTFLYLLGEPRGGGVSHLGHFGGMALGYLYVRFSDTVRSRFDDIVGNLSAFRLRMPRVRLHRTKTCSPEQIDALLDKIAAQGIASLTPKEKRLLKNASSRMR